MKGTVLSYDSKNRRGIICDSNQNRYSFHIGEWLSEEPIVEGEEVDFEIPKEEAINIKVKKRRDFFRILIEKGKFFF